MQLHQTQVRIILVSLFLTIGLVACGGAPTAQRSTNDVIAAFKAAGLEAENPTKMTKEDYGLAPMAATEATRFLIPSLGEDTGGRAFIFENQEDLNRTKAYYDELGKASAAFFSWTFTNGLTLVQITGDLPEDKAKQYEAALQGMK